MELFPESKINDGSLKTEILEQVFFHLLMELLQKSQVCGNVSAGAAAGLHHTSPAHFEICARDGVVINAKVQTGFRPGGQFIAWLKFTAQDSIAELTHDLQINWFIVSVVHHGSPVGFCGIDLLHHFQTLITNLESFVAK